MFFFCFCLLVIGGLFLYFCVTGDVSISDSPPLGDKKEEREEIAKKKKTVKKRKKKKATTIYGSEKKC